MQNNANNSEKQKYFVLRLTEQAVQLTLNLELLMLLAEQTMDIGLCKACEKALQSSKKCYADIQSIDAIITRGD